MFRLRFFFVALLVCSWTARCEVAPDPNRGLYAVWTKPGFNYDLSLFKGGQVILQWRWVQPAENRYDFSRLHSQLDEIARQGRVATVQLNANQLPAFLYEKVPHTTVRPGTAADHRGTLQYWHPYYVKELTDLIARFAKEVKASPHLGRVAGVRLSYDAIGTEHMIVPPEDRDLKRWVIPTGATSAPAWTEEAAAAYRRTVQEAYLRGFGPDIRVFLRSGVSSYPTPDLESIQTAEEGKNNVGFFSTAAQMEAGVASMLERNQKVFLAFCRPGKLVCYSEPLAGAGGESVSSDGNGNVGRSSSADRRWCGAEQWSYWRLLSDLNLGFSMIAIFGPDIEKAGNPEIRAGFEFAARYAGYHASPSVAPGAWVALREGSRLQKGDYSFLMRRLAGAPMKAEEKIGPAGQRFGAWAMTLAKGGSARFALDPVFAHSLAGKQATLRVTFLDRNEGTFTVHASGREFQAKLNGSGRWKTAEFAIDRAAFSAGGKGEDITITTGTDVTIHMIEVTR
jgi:hypothetical protein